MRRPESPAGPLRLGHIVYSNCFPVHARLIDAPAAGDPELIRDVPSALNRLLAAGEIHVAPSSSIEYAHHADRYRVLPDLVIGSRGPVRSIVFVSDRPPGELGGALVGLPTASATSVVLLKILLARRWEVDTRFIWFDQSRQDPFAAGASAALFIGDVALDPDLHPDRRFRFDLGEEWWAHTGLPFAFALWQTSAPERRDELRRLHAILRDSREFASRNRPDLAARYGAAFGMGSAFLERYWADLAFDLDAGMIAGVEAFYRLAAEIGEIATAPEIRWID